MSFVFCKALSCKGGRLELSSTLNIIWSAESERHLLHLTHNHWDCQ